MSSNEVSSSEKYFRDSLLTAAGERRQEKIDNWKKSKEEYGRNMAFIKSVGLNDLFYSMAESLALAGNFASVDISPCPEIDDRGENSSDCSITLKWKNRKDEATDETIERSIRVIIKDFNLRISRRDNTSKPYTDQDMGSSTPNVQQNPAFFFDKILKAAKF